jgi:hypothetical protein
MVVHPGRPVVLVAAVVVLVAAVEIHPELLGEMLAMEFSIHFILMEFRSSILQVVELVAEVQLTVALDHLAVLHGRQLPQPTPAPVEAVAVAVQRIIQADLEAPALLSLNI